jgi:ribulose-phosphate 3-epimerase
MLITPSILNADFANIAQEVRRVNDEADWLHLDVMDGHFVPNLSFGPAMVQAVKGCSQLPLDVHLMITSPEKWYQQYIDAGASNISFHYEATDKPVELANKIRSAGATAGLAIKPATSFDEIKDFLINFDLLLIMTVEPGFGGQSFMEDMLEKITKARDFITRNELKIKIQADGGINQKTIRNAYTAGADVFVAGSVVYGSDDPALAIRQLRDLIKVD